MEIKSIETLKAEYCVLDVETTGTSAINNRVIEIGIVKVRNGKIEDTFQSFINPGCYIPYFITNLTGIRNEDVCNAPEFGDIVSKISVFIGNSVVVGHNLQFDYGFLKQEFLRNGYDFPVNPMVCTLKLARKLYPSLPSKSLGSLVKFFRLRHKGVHRALGDASVTAKILLKFLTVLDEEYSVKSLDGLLSFQGNSAPKSSSYLMVKKKLIEDYNSLPQNPGVYFFKDSSDKIIYIGKAKNLKSRIRSYFSSSAPRKTKDIIRKADKLEYKITNTELTALLAEAELIKQFKPAKNSLLKKYTQSYFIRILNTHQFPIPETSTNFDFDGNDYFGPYSNRETSKALLEIIQKTFSMRECSEKELKKRKVCYLAGINRCLAPCINPDAKDYNSELLRVYEFLSGQNQFALDRLLNRMKRLSAELKYEEAAETRDTINLVLSQITRSSILAEPVNLSNVLVEISGADKNDYLLLKKGNVFIKDHLADKKDTFISEIDDFYAGTLNLVSEPDKKNLERIKISLTWLANNRNRIKVYYLNDYTSKEELLSKAGMR